jgi:hypothetical protein
MTPKRAERIIASEIKVAQLSANGTWDAYIVPGEYFGSGLYAYGETENEAIGNLVKAFYKAECLRVFELQEWKCARCGLRKALQGHHKIYRSHGRVDRDNVEGLCAKCHGPEHGG